MKMPASFIDGSCGRRPMMKTSKPRIATMTTTVMTQVYRWMSMYGARTFREDESEN